MNRSTYLQDSHVRAFIEWATPLIAGERKVIHKWYSRTLGRFSCETIYEAYDKYDWSSSVNLEEYRRQIRECISQSHPTAEAKSQFGKATKKVMEWGGITIYKWLTDLDDDALQILKERADLLHPEHADTDNLRGFPQHGIR